MGAHVLKSQPKKNQPTIKGTQKEMSKITMHVALGEMRDDESRLQIVRTPDGPGTGLLGRVLVVNEGRKSPVRIVPIGDEHDGDILVRFGTVEVESSDLRAVLEEGKLSGPSAPNVRTALLAAWGTTKLGKEVTLSEWKAANQVEWPVEEAVAPAAAPVGDAGGLEAALRAIADALRPATRKVGEIMDNWDAYTIPDVDPDMIPMFLGKSRKSANHYFKAAVRLKKNMALRGPTGSGKSYVVEQFSASDGLHFAFTDFSVATDTTALFDDVSIVDGDTVRRLTAVAMVLKYGGVWELREVNAAADDMATALYGPLSRDRKFTLSDGTVIPFADNVLIVATVNPPDAAHRHASKMSAALSRRLPWKFDVDYDTELESKLVKSEELIKLTGLIREAKVSTPFGTDTLRQIDAAIREFGTADGLDMLISHFDDEDDRQVVGQLVSVHREVIARGYGDTLDADVPEAFADLGFEDSPLS